MEYTEKIVCGSELFFANPLTFNDPFDCRPSFSMQATNIQIKEYYDGVLRRQAPGMNRAARRAESKQVATSPLRKPTIPKNLADFRQSYHDTVTRKIGLLCLSEVPDDPLLWSHYADSHRGICLVFDWQTEFFGRAQEVRYQAVRPIINPVFQSNEEMLDHALLTKSDHWKYEKEWRLVQYTKGAGSHAYPKSALVGIILGAMTTDKSKEVVREWIARLSHTVNMYRASLSQTEFKILVKPAPPL